MNLKIWEEVVKEIKNSGCKSVIVSGPQRSGTHIAARMLADVLSMTYTQEGEFHINRFDLFMSRISERTNVCVQAPGLAHKVHKVPEGWFVVFMFRDVGDIIKSQRRIDWKFSDYEKGKYEREFGLPKWLKKQAIAVIKYHIFQNKQFQEIKSRAAWMSYESLYSHPRWVAKEDRPKKLYKTKNAV